MQLKFEFLKYFSPIEAKLASLEMQNLSWSVELCARTGSV